MSWLEEVELSNTVSRKGVGLWPTSTLDVCGPKCLGRWCNEDWVKTGPYPISQPSQLCAATLGVIVRTQFELFSRDPRRCGHFQVQLLV